MGWWLLPGLGCAALTCILTCRYVINPLGMAIQHVHDYLGGLQDAEGQLLPAGGGLGDETPAAAEGGEDDLHLQLLEAVAGTRDSEEQDEQEEDEEEEEEDRHHQLQQRRRRPLFPASSSSPAPAPPASLYRPSQREDEDDSPPAGHRKRPASGREEDRERVKRENVEDRLGRLERLLERQVTELQRVVSRLDAAAPSPVSPSVPAAGRVVISALPPLPALGSALPLPLSPARGRR